MLQEISEATFDEEVLSSPVPVLVDFWAPWCGPCRTLTPTLERLADKYQDGLRIVKVNIDQNPLLKSEYNVMQIPRMILFQNGKPADALLGAHGQPTIEKMLSKWVGESAEPQFSNVPVDEEPEQETMRPASPYDFMVRPAGRKF